MFSSLLFQPAPEVKIVSNMPSIVMEEIAPVTVSDANLLAPEEVQDHVRGELKSSTEKEKTDRLRDRRQKKSAQRVRHKEKERAEKAVDKANPGLGNKHARTRALENLQKAEKEGTVSLVSLLLPLVPFCQFYQIDLTNCRSRRAEDRRPPNPRRRFSVNFRTK